MFGTIQDNMICGLYLSATLADHWWSRTCILLAEIEAWHEVTEPGVTSATQSSTFGPPNAQQHCR